MTVNVGWCADDKDAIWSRKGDYVTGKKYYVERERETME